MLVLEGSSFDGKGESSAQQGEGSGHCRSVNVETFHVFLHFPREIQDLIWLHALPGPRVIELEVKQLECLVSIKKSSELAPQAKWYDRDGWTEFRSLIRRAFQRHGRVDPLDKRSTYQRVDFVKILEKTPTKPPGILSACRDSRRVALNSLVHHTHPWSKEEVSATEYKYVLSYDRGRHRGYRYARAGAIVLIDDLLPPPIWYNPQCDTIYLKESNLDRLSFEKLGFRDIQSLAVSRTIWYTYYWSKPTPRLLFDTDDTPAVFPDVKELVLVCHKRKEKKIWRVQAEMRTQTSAESHPSIRIVTEPELLGERKTTRHRTIAEKWVESYHHLDDFQHSI